MTHRRSERFLLGGTAKFFKQKVKSRRARKAKLKAERKAQFRKGFVHKSSEPKSFDVKPQLPTRGKKRRFRIF
jgi:hypothetical protein